MSMRCDRLIKYCNKCLRVIIFVFSVFPFHTASAVHQPKSLSSPIRKWVLLPPPPLHLLPPLDGVDVGGCDDGVMAFRYLPVEWEYSESLSREMEIKNRVLGECSRDKSGRPPTAPLSMPHSSLPRTMRKKPSSPQSLFWK
jgi:hypothetical protein